MRKNWISLCSVVSLSLRDEQSQGQGTRVQGQQVYPGRSLGCDSPATQPSSRPDPSSLRPWLVSRGAIGVVTRCRVSVPAQAGVGVGCDAVSKNDRRPTPTTIASPTTAVLC